LKKGVKYNEVERKRRENFLMKMEVRERSIKNLGEQKEKSCELID